jgi:hypothetical protein
MFEQVIVTGGHTPLPLSGTFCVRAFGSLLVIVRLAIREPASVGWKTMLTVRLAPAASVVWPLSAVILKSSLSRPVTATLVIVSDERVVPQFWRVTVLGALVVPFYWSPKDRLLGLGQSAGAGCSSRSADAQVNSSVQDGVAVFVEFEVEV